MPDFPEEGVIPLPGRPLLARVVPAGMPTACDHRFESRILLDEYLIDNSVATYFVRVTGDSMTGFGIHDGDLLVVEQGIDPPDRSIVIANVGGEFTVKQICRLPEGILLRACGRAHGDILVTHRQELAIWGVVRWSIHKVGSGRK